MIVQFRVVYLGRVLSTEEREYVGSFEDNRVQIEDETHNGMDPLHLARHGKAAVWGEAKVVQA